VRRRVSTRRRMSGLNSAGQGRAFVPGVYHGKALTRGTIIYVVVRISAKSGNPWSSYSDLTTLIWPPSAILDV